MRDRVSTATAIQREVLGQGQGPVRARSLPGAEPFGAAQQDARRELVLPVQVEQGVGGEPPPVRWRAPK